MADRWEWLRIFRGGAYNRLSRTPGLDRAFVRLNDQLFVRQFARDLCRLHDVLSGTDLAGRYWVWSGMLLGWAREGALIAHDRDADFGLVPEDLSRLLRATPALRRAGFQPLHQFRNNEGRVTELMFRRHRAMFDFCVLEPVDGMLRYYVYGWLPEDLIEVEAQLPNQELVTFDFLGRTWLRHADYERELEMMYGDWRTPQRDWDCVHDDKAAVCHRPRVNLDTSWSV